MQERGAQLEAQAAAAGRERQQLAALADERRGALAGVEQELLEERARLDGQAKAERLRQVALLEAQYRCVSRLVDESVVWFLVVKRCL